MNRQIADLYKIAQKHERLILGLMSGTSLDGLDLALCRLRGAGKATQLELVQFHSFAYDEVFRNHVRAVFAKNQIDQAVLCGLHAYIGLQHAEMILATLQQWGVPPAAVDLIASHGQTVFHAPRHQQAAAMLPDSTLQIGDADHIAVTTGIITIADFRQKHLAAGGQGAPLVAYGDYLLYTAAGENRILLNIGGIANFTFLPRHGADRAAYATDVGPGNTLMDQYMQRYAEQEMDRNASLAQRGQLNPLLLNALLALPFFEEDFPKTTGPELFHITMLEKIIQQLGLRSLSHEDVMATLCHYSARSIAAAIRKATAPAAIVHAVYVSGGGLHNPLLMQLLRAELADMPVRSAAEIGCNPDAKEACLFAVLANETIAGSPDHVRALQHAPAVCMGKISLPH